jgi:hypothetical protein
MYCNYMDFFNITFIDMSREKRIKGIPTMVKRLVEWGDGHKELGC